nr:hypothetical protein MarFTME_354 [Marseillevirus futianmevirus]
MGRETENKKWLNLDKEELLLEPNLFVMLQTTTFSRLLCKIFRSTASLFLQ